MGVRRLESLLSRWIPDRWLVFTRFLGRRFVDDNCFEVAGALSYNTIFALVPLSMAIVGIMSAFPLFQSWKSALTQFVFNNFMPAYGLELQNKIIDFADKARGLTGISVIGFIVAALMMMHTIEEVFNRIFHAPRRRRRTLRFMIYWTVLTLGPILLVSSLGLSSYVLTRSVGSIDSTRVLMFKPMLALLPVLVTWVCTTMAYWIIPNRVVRFRHAAIGGALATLLFETAKYEFAIYLAHANYSQVYDALVVPILVLLFWIYVSWSVVLLGASLSATLSVFRYLPAALQVTSRFEFVYLIKILSQIEVAAGEGRPLNREALGRLEPNLSDNQIDRFLLQLQSAKIIQINESGDCLILRRLQKVTIAELFYGGEYRLPSSAELKQLLEQNLKLSAALVAWLQHASVNLDACLSQPVGTVVQATE
jgi:membrane protein